MKYTAVPLYHGPIDRGNWYNADVLWHPLMPKNINKTKKKNNKSRTILAGYNADA